MIKFEQRRFIKVFENRKNIFRQKELAAFAHHRCTECQTIFVFQNLSFKYFLMNRSMS